MDSDLLTVARTLAERGWLPGIREKDLDMDHGVLTFFDAITNDYTPAEPFLLMSAVQYITDPERRWGFEMDEGLTRIWDENGRLARSDGTTTLSLLRALRAACEEHERATQQASEKKETKP